MTDWLSGGVHPLIQILFWLAFIIVLATFIWIVILLASARVFEKRQAQTRNTDPEAETGFLWLFLVPALDEERTIADSVSRLRASHAAHSLIVVIDDGSTDGTPDELARLAGPDLLVLTRRLPDARVGKAAALNHAYRVLLEQLAPGGRLAGWTPDRVIVTVVDADGRLDVAAPREVGSQFRDPLLGGVQVRVRIYNRSRFLTWCQDLEFAAAGLLYQAGRATWGTANMGGNGQFNRLSALTSVSDGIGPWRDRLTEDQDLGVRLLQAGWRNSQENDVEVHQQGIPTPRRLYRQRIRWTQGAWQAVGLLGGVGKMRSPLVSRVDGVFYLLAPILQVIVLINLVTAIVLVLVFGVPILPASLWIAALFITIGFGPGVLALSKTQHGIRGMAFGLVAILPYTLYCWFVVPTLIISLVRQLAGRRAWAKTSRELISPGSTPGGRPDVDYRGEVSTFPPDVVAAVLHHMNDDHTDDSVVIVRAFAGVEPTAAEMSGLDEHAGFWRYTLDGAEHELRVPWSKELTERPEIRREVVMVYRAACEKLGIDFRGEH